MAPRPIPPPGSLGARLVNVGTKVNILVYRLSGGRVLNSMNDGKAPLLLLDHVGAKSGQRRTAPLIYAEDGADLAIVGSRGGSPAMPGWVFNLRANPDTTVQVGRQRRAVVAREATGEERERWWARAVAIYPDYDVYQSRTDRELPVIILSPRP
jgi:deazaflavin-dependent oxidoreductase (nitroreductase family)